MKRYMQQCFLAA